MKINVNESEDRDNKELLFLKSLNAEPLFDSKSFFYVWGVIGILLSAIISFICFVWGRLALALFSLYPLLSTIVISLLQRNNTSKETTDRISTRAWIFFTNSYFYLTSWTWIAAFFLGYDSYIGIMVANLLFPGFISTIIGISSNKNYFYSCGLLSSLFGIIAMGTMIEYSIDYRMCYIYCIIFFIAFVVPQFLSNVHTRG